MRILITTIHPGPYIDKWVEVLRKEHYVDVMYVQKANSEKVWKNYTVKEAYYYDDFSFIKTLKFFKTYDFVLFGGWYTKINILFAQFLKFSKTKTAFFSDHPENKKQKIVEKYLKKKIIQSCDYLFATSESTKNFYIETYKLKEDTVRIFPYAHNYNFSPSINTINEKIKIFIANRFIERKGYSVVLNCFKNLKNKNILDNYEITIVGGGVEYEYYKKEFSVLSSSIKILEWVENDEYIEYLKSTNIYLHASLFEPFGIPPLDAMQLGKMVIVSDGVKSVNLLKGKSTGLIVYKNDDYKELTDIFTRISSSKELISEGNHNFDLINQVYNSTTLLNAFHF